MPTTHVIDDHSDFTVLAIAKDMVEASFSQNQENRENGYGSRFCADMLHPLPLRLPLFSHNQLSKSQEQWRANHHKTHRGGQLFDRGFITEFSRPGAVATGLQ